MALARFVTFDVETYRTQPGLLAPPLVCGTFTRDGVRVTLLGKRATLRHLRRLLQLPNVIFCGHRVAYDFAVICAEDPTLLPLVFKAYDEGRVRDTQIRQELIDIAKGRKNMGKDDEGEKQYLVLRDEGWVKASYSLAALTSYHLGKDRFAEKQDDNRWQLRFDELDGIPVKDYPPDAAQYAKDDTGDTHRIYLSQCREGEVDDLLPTEVVQAQAAWWLHLASCWGVRTDAEAVDKLETALRLEKDKAFKRLQKLGFYKPKRATPDDVAAGKVDFWEDVPPTKKGKLRAPRPMRYSLDRKLVQQIVERVYKKYGRGVPMTERPREASEDWESQIATHKDALMESGSKVLALLSGAGGIDKAMQYLPALKLGTEVPINSQFHAIMNSGRTSSSGPNLQNLPSGRRVGGIRETIITRPGFLWAGLDYKMLELCILAQVCYELFGFSDMRDAIIAGKDLHLIMGASLEGVEYEDILKRHAAGDKKAERSRDAGKVGNFGLPGGLGAGSLVDYARAGYGLRLTRPEAVEIKQTWQTSFREMVLFLRRASEFVGDDAATFHDPVTGFTRALCDYCTFLNMHFQSRAAYGAKMAGFRIAYECYVDTTSPLYGSRIVVFVHDEFDIEVPKDRASAAVLRAKQIMIEEMQKVCPDVPIDVEPAISERWFKKAKAVYLPNGELGVWKPKAA